MEDPRDMTVLLHPATQRVVGVASRKGVALDIRVVPSSTRTAADAARTLDADLGQIVRSLVFVAPRADGRLASTVCLVSGRNQVDLRQLAAVVGEVALRAASAREARDLTGFAVGGIPPFGHGRDVRVVMDQDLCQYQWVWAAAGTDTAAFRVAPRTLRMLSNAVVAPVAGASWLPATVGASYEPRLRFETAAGA
jgi:prolyl-tRNA editing enzyme YbaK/EbsC (Cys-tRNA(Pro) deacylase)